MSESYLLTIDPEKLGQLAAYIFLGALLYLIFRKKRR